MITPSEDMLSSLKARYQEPQRAYHTWEHIEALLRHFNDATHLLYNPTSILWALYWHDAIYDPKRPDNEMVSAELLREEAKSILSEAQLGLAALIVEATARHQQPEGLDDQALSDTAHFLDMDLSILAAREDIFDSYEDQIRFEYSFVPIAAYKAARANILQGFLAREHLYFTDHFRNQWEAKARDNLARSIERLVS